MSERVSIIVAVRNASHQLAACLDSILSQTYRPVEVIVVDGESTDGSVEILATYSERLAYWTSEPDAGIYDAWNKGLRHATGDWIAFVGADDRYASPEALALAMGQASLPKFNFISFKNIVVDEQGVERGLEGRALDARTIGEGMRITHPGALHHRSLFDGAEHPFDASFRIAADFDFFLRVAPRIRAGFLPIPIMRVGDGGVSRRRVRQCLVESAAALMKNGYVGRLGSVRFIVVALLKAYARTVIVRMKRR